MPTLRPFIAIPTFALILSFVASCTHAVHAADVPTLPKPATDLPAPKDGDPTTRTAVFAGGCFWCVESAFEQLKGVSDVVSGYAGGTKETATYEAYATTGHVEVVKITYDPKVISYADLLHVLFTISEPTVKNKQGPDAGPQYRMAVFYASDDEKQVAQAYIKQLADAKIYGDKKIETTLDSLTSATPFYPAEDYHQDYVRKNPTQPYVRAWSIPKRDLTRAKFPELIQSDKSSK